jgi:hypothetical protein
LQFIQNVLSRQHELHIEAAQARCDLRVALGIKPQLIVEEWWALCPVV